MRVKNAKVESSLKSHARSQRLLHHFALKIKSTARSRGMRVCSRKLYKPPYLASLLDTVTNNATDILIHMCEDIALLSNRKN